jgi:cell division protein FtsL
MKTKFAETLAPAPPDFARVKRFTRKRHEIDPMPGAPAVPADYFRSEPKKRSAKDMTTFNLVVLLVVTGVVIVAYISNILMVDSIMNNISGLRKEEVALSQERENLRAEINMLSSYTRIQKEAERLKLLHARQQPYSLLVTGLPVHDISSAGE